MWQKSLKKESAMHRNDTQRFSVVMTIDYRNLKPTVTMNMF